MKALTKVIILIIISVTVSSFFSTAHADQVTEVATGKTITVESVCTTYSPNGTMIKVACTYGGYQVTPQVIVK